MSSIGSATGGERPQFEPGDPQKTAELLSELKETTGRGPAWLSFLDSAGPTKRLADQLLADGRFTAADAKALVKDAKDYGGVKDAEKAVFATLLREHAGKIDPEARDALSQLFGLPIGRPGIVGAYPGEMRVVEGPSEYSLDDDKLIMTGDGSFTSSIGRDIYTAGYLPMAEGPMLEPMGTDAAPSSVLSEADNKLNEEKSPVERFDEAFKRATGRDGKLADRYETEGKRPEADSWWGFCDRWAYAALDPEIATRVNEPIQYKGVYFSTAELRGLASFLGRSDESGGLFDKSVSALDLQKAAAMFLKENGPGFIGDVWLDSAHPGNMQVWNQPFDSVDQSVKELKGSELEKVLKEQFNLSGADARDKRIFYVETTGKYGVEEGEEYEGPATHSEKNWKSYILAEPDGTAIDGKYAEGSDDALEYIWRPNRSGNFTKEAQFLRDLLKGGVPSEKLHSFEEALGGLSGRVDAQTKADLVRRFAGVAAGYPDGDLDRKLAPFGLSASDFR